MGQKALEEKVLEQLNQRGKECIKGRAANPGHARQTIGKWNQSDYDIQNSGEGQKFFTLNYTAEGTNGYQYFGTTSRYRLTGEVRIIRNYYEGKDIIEITSFDCVEIK